VTATPPLPADPDPGLASLLSVTGRRRVRTGRYTSTWSSMGSAAALAAGLLAVAGV
jgi:hypothetical protein